MLSARGAHEPLGDRLDNFQPAFRRAPWTSRTTVSSLVETNRPALTVAVSNLSFFSEQLNQFASRLDARCWPPTRRRSTPPSRTSNPPRHLDNICWKACEQGKGLAGKLLENEEIAANVSQIVSNLSITTSNLNRWACGASCGNTSRPGPTRLPRCAGR